MRPLTGLRDMFFSLDPGSEHRALPTAARSRRATRSRWPTRHRTCRSTRSSRRSTTTTRLTCVRSSSAPARDSRAAARTSGRILGSLGPINRDLERLNTAVAQRDENLSRLVHNLSILTKSIGTQDQDIDAARDRVERRARGDRLGGSGRPDGDPAPAWRARPRRAMRSRRRRSSATSSDRRSTRSARSPATCPSSTPRRRELAETVTPVIRDEIRPFVRSAREPIPDLNQAAGKLSKSAPGLETDREEAEQPREHGGLQPARQGARRHGRP